MTARLNLGSGNEPLAGFVNVDRRMVAGVSAVVDVQALPFRSQCASSVVASSLLEHFADPYAVLDEVHRVLTPDGQFVMRVPSPWSVAGQLDRTHVFLADVKLWRQILGGYFADVRVAGEGVRHRDHKPLAAALHVAVQILRMHEFAQTWLFPAVVRWLLRLAPTSRGGSRRNTAGTSTAEPVTRGPRRV